MKKFSILALAMTSFLSHAAIEGFEFTDPSNDSKLVKTNTSEATLINNAGLLNVHVSAGLDRRIRIKVKQGTDVISTEIGDVITVNDAFSPFGNEYFGSKISVSIPSDGDYSIIAETVSLIGDVVDSKKVDIVRDTTPPTFDTMNVIKMYGGHVNSLLPAGSWYLSHMQSDHHTTIQVTGLSDPSGIGTTELETFTFDDQGNRQPYKQQEMTYTESLKTTALNLFTYKYMFPHGDNANTRYQTRAKLTDRAGNVTYTNYQDVYYDTVTTNSLMAIGVKVPGSNNTIAGLTGFEPYVGSMEVDTNPVTILYRVEAWNYRDDSGNFNNPGGLMVAGADAVYTDRNDGYVYFTDTGPIGSITISWRNQAHYRNITGPNLYYVVPSSTAPVTPRATGGQYFYSDTNAWGSWSRRVYNWELPVQIEKIRLFAQARPFEQKAVHGGTNTCNIRAGATHCDIVLSSPWKMVHGGSAYYHSYFNVRNLEETLISDPIYPVGTYNDNYYPTVEETSFNEDTKVLSVRIVQACQYCYQGRIGLSKFELQDQNFEKLDITPIKSTYNGGTFEIEYDLTQLPEGSYQIYVYAQERHGPEDRKLAVNYVSDKTPPTIQFGYDGSSLPPQVTDLRQVSFKLTDISDIKDIEIKLTGSRYDIDYQLGYSLSNVSGDSQTYQLELPKLFPTLEDGEVYSLTVTAVDEFNNSTTDSVDISYKPENLIVMKTIDYLSSAVNQPLYLSDDSPMAVIITNSALTLENSMMATGLQTAEVTNNITSAFPIKLRASSGWVDIYPGETKNVQIDLGTGKPLHVEIYPIDAGVEGKADFLFNIPQLTSAHLN